jgi:hypothetical protein
MITSPKRPVFFYLKAAREGFSLRSTLGIDRREQLGKLMKNIFITVVALGFIAGCSGSGSLGGSAGSSAGSSGGSSGASSGGFFAGIGTKREEEVVLEQRLPRVDNRTLIAVVNEVKVDNFRGGALIKAKGTTSVQGYGDVDLVEVNKGLPDENGVVTYEFKGNKPEAGRTGPTKRANEVYAGNSIPATRLPSVKRILIIAEQNQIIVTP